MATLFVVATPIGNLEDVTLRALRVLKEVDVVLCEDTRMTKRLLSHYGIDTATLSYHSQSGDMKIEKIIEMLAEGKSLALVSDAGTPTISDPGSLLVSRVREHFGSDVSVVAVPGASALTAALSIAGVPASDFLFLGFLPHKKGRETLFSEIAASERTVVFYESTHRLMKALESLKSHLAPTRKIAVVREITKVFEEVVKGTPEEVIAHFSSDTQKQRGEFVIIVEA